MITPPGTKVIELLKSARFRQWSVPIALLILCVVSYGLLLHRLGFYWDDWPWIWLAHVSGPDSLLKIDQAYRPLSGVILWLSQKIAGEQPLRWQWLALVFRWLSGVALWWALRQLWPRQSGRLAWVACLFLVYPGFTHQFVSVNSSRHILPLGSFFISFGLMIASIRSKAGYLPLMAASLLLGLVTMLSTEYYYGLELTRPLWIWLTLGEGGSDIRSRARKTLLHWTPYLAILIGIFAWRYLVSQSANYAITLPASFAADPYQATLLTVHTLWRSFANACFYAWGKIFAFPTVEIFGQKKTWFYWALVSGSAALALIYLTKSEAARQSNGWWKQAVFLGIASVLVGSLPFLVTGLAVSLGFPSSRATLPLALGASLLLTGLLDGVIKPRLAKIGLIALILGLSVGAQFQSAVDFQRDWSYQAAFFNQLAWRIPGLKPGTAIFTQELPYSYSSDNSLTAPLNWAYAPNFSGGELPYKIYYLENRLGGAIPALESGQNIFDDYGEFEFQGSTDDVLVVYHAPPACLRVLHPTYDAAYPHLPDLLSEALPLANLDAIRAGKDSQARPPDFFGSEAENSWCYYFQKADLARQEKDWGKVVELAELAFNCGDSPNHATERAPFIQGYAYTGNWERAKELTFEMIRINKFTSPILCSIWEDIAGNTDASTEREATLQEIVSKLGCSIPID